MNDENKILWVRGINADTTGFTPLPNPSALELSLMDIDASSTSRSADGTILRDRVCGAGSAKRKLQLEWAYIDNDTASTILKAIADEFFYVRYPDPYEGAERTAVFYAGDRSLPMYNAVIKNGGILWEKLSVHLIEK